jgi:hypothetical protein
MDFGHSHHLAAADFRNITKIIVGLHKFSKTDKK